MFLTNSGQGITFPRLSVKAPKMVETSFLTAQSGGILNPVPPKTLTQSITAPLGESLATRISYSDPPKMEVAFSANQVLRIYDNFPSSKNYKIIKVIYFFSILIQYTQLVYGDDAPGVKPQDLPKVLATPNGVTPKVLQ
jgi:hypothetical protein